MRVGKQMQFFGARVNLPKTLLYALNGGRDEITGEQIAPKLEPILPSAGAAALDNLCLCHTRCNAQSGDNTAEVLHRLQLKSTEAAKPAKRRKPARRAA